MCPEGFGEDPCTQYGPAGVLRYKMKWGEPSEESETSDSEIAFVSVL